MKQFPLLLCAVALACSLAVWACTPQIETPNITVIEQELQAVAQSHFRLGVSYGALIIRQYDAAGLPSPSGRQLLREAIEADIKVTGTNTYLRSLQ